MPKLLRNVLGVLAGIIIGSAANFVLVAVGPSIIPPPPGVDVTTAEGFSKGMALHLFQPRHFIMPFLAHAIGSLVGAVAAYLVAASYKTPIAIAVGAVFFCGGVAATFLIPAPKWFIAVDLVAAYLPMAWLGILIGSRMGQQKAAAQT